MGAKFVYSTAFHGLVCLFGSAGRHTSQPSYVQTSEYNRVSKLDVSAHQVGVRVALRAVMLKKCCKVVSNCRT